MSVSAVERLSYKTADFKAIQSILHTQAGINLHDGKRELVYSRLAKRVRSLGFGSFRDYCSLLDQDESEILECINSLTTNVTSFFRERHHFDFLKSEFLMKESSEKIRIWSAGCSSGEEPYSLAFTCADYPGRDVDILATDLDSQVVQKGINGVYRDRDIASLPRADLKRWFLRGRGAREGQVKVLDHYRKMVSFAQLNLKHNWHHDEPFDVIFCRNVMIYFDNELRANLLEKFHSALKPGGYLILGHSESLFGLSDRFKVVGKTVHKKKDD